jgi:hypothetical protein
MLLLTILSSGDFYIKEGKVGSLGPIELKIAHGEKLGLPYANAPKRY